MFKKSCTFLVVETELVEWNILIFNDSYLEGISYTAEWILNTTAVNKPIFNYAILNSYFKPDLNLQKTNDF